MFGSLVRLVYYLTTLSVSRLHSVGDTMIGEMRKAEKTEVLGKACTSATLSTTNPTMTWSGTGLN
jgi:hypothetical protein